MANPKNGKYISVPIQVKERKDVTMTYGNGKNYDWSGYEINIDFNSSVILELGKGNLEVWIKCDIDGELTTFKIGAR